MARDPGQRPSSRGRSLDRAGGHDVVRTRVSTPQVGRKGDLSPDEVVDALVDGLLPRHAIFPDTRQVTQVAVRRSDDPERR